MQRVNSYMDKIYLNKQVIFRFLSFLKPYWFKESVVFVLMILGTVSSLTFPYIMKVIIDDAFPNKDYELLIQMVLLFSGIALFNLVVSFVSDYLYSWVSNHIILDMRSEFFNHLIHLPWSFYNQNKTGDIVYRIENEIGIIQSLITSSVLTFVHNVLLIAGIAIALCWLNYQMFLISIVLFPFIVFNVRYFQPKIRKIVELGQKKRSDIMSFLMERFGNIRLIQIYDRYRYENQKLKEKMHDLVGINMRSVVLSSSMRSITGLCMMFTPLLVLGWGGHQVMLGAMTLGSLVAFLQYLSRFFTPFRNLNRLYIDLVRTSVSMTRVFEFMNLPVPKETGQFQGGCFSFQNKIAFQGIDFGYNGHPVLKNFNLELVKGRTYALVGPSGCGKSSLVNLLCRFYEPDRGAIIIDGCDLRDVDLVELRGRIGLVAQDDSLFHDTVLENIRYGKLESTDCEIEQAVRLTGLNGQSSGWEGGLNFVIGDQGKQVSGGQKQRIALARALLKNADILILDEATSALDSGSEKEVFDGLRNLYADKTMVIVSHRLSAIKDVDEIICMAEGRVVERGTHLELVEKRGYYWRLVQNQIE